MHSQPQMPAGMLEGAGALRGISGLFLSGVLMAVPGAILPVWRHHIEPNYAVVGGYFLSLNLGMLAVQTIASPLRRRYGLATTMSLGSGAGALALVLLALACPPAPFWWRLGGLLLAGAGAGLLNTSAFHALTGAYELNRASTLNLSGTLFGLGAFACAFFVASTFFIYVPPSLLVLLAVLPALAAGLYVRASLPPDRELKQPTLREALADFRSPAALLFALLLFFQCGNEGTLGGWLALYLTQRLGASPATSLTLLSVFWLALLLGRLGVQWLLGRVRHSRLLAAAVLAQMFGSIVLMATNNLFGATMGVLLAGCGFAVILPMVLERVADRFPYFHPGFFNGIFSVALTGGLLAPASLGLFAHYLGVGVVMGLPLAGSAMVLVLLLLIMIEARLSSRGEA